MKGGGSDDDDPATFLGCSLFVSLVADSSEREERRVRGVKRVPCLVLRRVRGAKVPWLLFRWVFISKASFLLTHVVSRCLRDLLGNSISSILEGHLLHL
jgi:hypothetical protein